MHRPPSRSTGRASGTTPVACGIPRWTRSTGRTSTRLKPAWTYHTGELEGRTGKTIECTPIVVDGVMYVTTGYLRVVALDAATGKELWQFDPAQGSSVRAPAGVRRRQPGLCAYWSDGKPGGERRIIHGTSDGRLFSLDARTGKLDPEFGDGGIRNLRKELDPKVAALGYGPTSAPAVWKDTIIVGVSCGEGPGIAAPGDIRAFDVRTGKEVWRFRTVPRPGEFGHETWKGDSWKDRGGANAWGGFSVDVGSRPGLRRARVGGLRLLRRRPARRQPVRELHDRARRQDGQAGLALPDACATTCGTTTCRSIRTSSPSRATARRSTPSPR